MKVQPAEACREVEENIQASIDSAGTDGSFSLAICSFQLFAVLHSCPTT